MRIAVFKRCFVKPPQARRRKCNVVPEPVDHPVNLFFSSTYPQRQRQFRLFIVIAVCIQTRSRLQVALSYMVRLLLWKRQLG